MQYDDEMGQSRLDGAIVSRRDILHCIAYVDVIHPRKSLAAAHQGVPPCRRSDDLHRRRPRTCRGRRRRPPSAGSSRPRILVPEKLSPDGLALLTPHFDVDVRQNVSAEELVRIIPDYQGLLVRSETKVTAEVLRAGSQLKVVARAGVGVDNIDVPAATARGVLVVNSPAGNIVAAAEHTVALLLATARHIGRADRGVKDGRWERAQLVGVEVGRKTLGIVGLGKVGLHVARMAKGLGMAVVAVDPYANPDMAKQAGVELYPALHDMLPVLDFLTIHTPLLATTLDLIGEAELKMMKSTARVLNVARGGVYNEAALLRALDDGCIAGAGLDVFTTEPPAADSVAARLTRHPKVVATPHLGASTVEAQENVSMDVCTQTREILRGGLPTSAVNAPIILPEQYRKLQPSVSLVEKMGRLYSQHFAGSNSTRVGGRTFELVYHGELAGLPNTKPLLAALVKGLVASFSDSNVNIVNATQIAKEKGITVSETHAHDSRNDQTYVNLVSLRSYPDGGGAKGRRAQVIEGYASSNKRLYISRLGRFNATFSPEGTLIILHNYDEPGKIGGVGTVLGSHGINIRFMQVAALGAEFRGDWTPPTDDGLQPSRSQDSLADTAGTHPQQPGDEALMILGIAGNVDKKVMDDLKQAEGVLDVSVVTL
ncbi:d-3-phosphoglycerate dehydrogenase [Cordyceps militaris CM01]|uniref:D-3-phosphoglycerate dehydrogenase n=1 Tax=Cordyceps militaris (strain CM01) TaxID=983644 RepID=G3JHT4_CORMM|nr:d-3-phosphoglycerate dehydrogenase [Cordyceps militaris CM01]EGX90940.1 d-3-phosphoglycerate dehydrogenase [Cordyceps militaris CM01]